ncbi:TetR/AcrR family transcriptional regulator [Streptomyces platensis]|uniref:TetR/AcrR family transcriptional regulator n=1 Tax=Streptomyces platensis TaxID=58346 RepID=UPI001F3D3ABC|nr:TetR/AcrR family transcriptional regulator [Streptomyces platensis]
MAAERGLHAASLREVAAEAGVSLRAVQYHFGSKHRLLVDALHLLHAENERIARCRIPFDATEPGVCCGRCWTNSCPSTPSVPPRCGCSPRTTRAA